MSARDSDLYFALVSRGIQSTKGDLSRNPRRIVSSRCECALTKPGMMAHPGNRTTSVALPVTIVPFSTEMRPFRMGWDEAGQIQSASYVVMQERSLCAP